jgi:hypothetical protein
MIFTPPEYLHLYLDEMGFEPNHSFPILPAVFRVDMYPCADFLVSGFRLDMGKPYRP